MGRYETIITLLSDNIEAAKHLCEKLKRYGGISFDIISEYDDPFAGYHAGNIQKSKLTKRFSSRTWLTHTVRGKFWDCVIEHLYNSTAKRFES